MVTMRAPRRRLASLIASLIAVLAALWLAGGSWPPMVESARAQSPVALELVLAVDCSSSVSGQEFALQMDGFAAAFRDPGILAAIQEGGRRGVAIAMVHWSGALNQQPAIDWTLIETVPDALAFADEIDRTPRVVTGGPTAVGTAIDVATRWILDNDFEGERKIIDVSGDGRANQGVPAAAARHRANTLGITINGLAILNEEPDLDRYYRAGVVGGPGSFLITAEDYEAFARAIQRKLYFEITGPPISERERPSGRGQAASR